MMKSESVVVQSRNVSITMGSSSEKQDHAPRQIPSAVSPKSQPASPLEDLSMTTSSSFLEDDRMRLLPNSQLQIFGRTKHPGVETVLDTTAVNSTIHLSVLSTESGCDGKRLRAFVLHQVDITSSGRLIIAQAPRPLDAALT